MKLRIIIPDHLDEITLRQYKEFMLMQADEEIDDVVWMKQVLALFCKGDVDQIEKFKKKQIENIFSNLLELLNNSEPNMDKVITIDGVNYGFIPNLSSLTIGEFMDLETFMKEGIWHNMEKVLAILYRPINNKAFGKYNIVDYTGDLNGRDKLFLDKFPLTILHGVLVFFFDYRKRIIDGYSALFNSPEQETQFQFKSGIEWGWYEAIVALSNGDVTKFDDVSNLNVDTALTYLLYLKDKANNKSKL